MEASTGCGRRSERESRRQSTELWSSAKLIFVRINVMMLAYKSSFLRLSLLATCSITRVAEGPAPPVQEKNQRTENALLNIYNSRLVFQFFDIFVVAIRVFNIFRAAFGKEVEDFYIEKHFCESAVPEAIGFNIQSCVIFSAGSFICKGLTLQRQKIRLDFNIKTNFLKQIGESRMSLCLKWVYPPLGQ